MEGGDIFCRDSIRFRSINDDLIDEELWRTSKEELIAKAGLGILCQPIGKHLAELKEPLETRLSEVNRRIATGANTHFKLKGNGRWTLEYPGDDEETNHFARPCDNTCRKPRTGAKTTTSCAAPSPTLVSASSASKPSMSRNVGWNVVV